MSHLGRVILRLVLVPIGYFVGIVFAVLLVSAVSMGRAYGPVADDPALVGMTGMVIATDAFVLTWVFGGAALMPALAAIALSEAFAIRGFIYFVLAGIAVAAVVDRLIEPGVVAGLPGDVLTGTAAGMLGGLAYWVVAGRGAGLRPRPA